MSNIYPCINVKDKDDNDVLISLKKPSSANQICVKVKDKDGVDVLAALPDTAYMSEIVDLTGISKTMYLETDGDSSRVEDSDTIAYSGIYSSLKTQFPEFDVFNVRPLIGTASADATAYCGAWGSDNQFGMSISFTMTDGTKKPLMGIGDAFFGDSPSANYARNNLLYNWGGFNITSSQDITGAVANIDVFSEFTPFDLRFTGEINWSGKSMITATRSDLLELTLGEKGIKLIDKDDVEFLIGINPTIGSRKLGTFSASASVPYGTSFDDYTTAWASVSGKPSLDLNPRLEWLYIYGSFDENWDEYIGDYATGNASYDLEAKVDGSTVSLGTATSSTFSNAALGHYMGGDTGGGGFVLPPSIDIADITDIRLAANITCSETLESTGGTGTVTFYYSYDA